MVSTASLVPSRSVQPWKKHSCFHSCERSCEERPGYEAKIKDT